MNEFVQSIFLVHFHDKYVLILQKKKLTLTLWEHETNYINCTCYDWLFKFEGIVVIMLGYHCFVFWRGSRFFLPTNCSCLILVDGDSNVPSKFQLSGFYSCFKKGT